MVQIHHAAAVVIVTNTMTIVQRAAQMLFERAQQSVALAARSRNCCWCEMAQRSGALEFQLLWQRWLTNTATATDNATDHERMRQQVLLVGNERIVVAERVAEIRHHNR